MTNDETIQTTDREVIIPEFALPPGLTDKVRRLAEVLGDAQLLDDLGEVYRELVPVYEQTHAAGEVIWEDFSQKSGHHELWLALSRMGGACLAVMKAGVNDLDFPEWVTEDDLREREIRALQAQWHISRELAERATTPVESPVDFEARDSAWAEITQHIREQTSTIPGLPDIPPATITARGLTRPPLES